ncbi:MAG: FIST N-terminal domain-containing protein [Cyanobacteria bacterium J06634_6]
MFKAAVGHGIDPDEIGAITEALEQCQQILDNDTPQAGILLAAVDFDHAVILRHIRDIYPEITLVGGTSVGEMSSTMGFQQDSLTLMLFSSDEVTFRAGYGSNVSADTTAAATAAIEQALADSGQTVKDMKLCYSLCEALKVDGAALVSDLRVATKQQVPIFGGLTADDYQFAHTYQFFNDEVLEDTVVVLAFFGELKVSFGVATGQKPTGPKATITKSESYTVHEIDHQPARNFYAPYFGKEEVRVARSGAFTGPLAVYEPGEINFYVRAPNGGSKEDGSVSYFGNVPEGSTVQITDTDRESLVQSAQDAFSKAKFAYPGKEPRAVIMTSCVSRMKNLGMQVNKEHEVVEAIAGTNLPNIGFYAYGEISPFSETSATYFHNETFTALLIGTR